MSDNIIGELKAHIKLLEWEMRQLKKRLGDSPRPAPPTPPPPSKPAPRNVLINEGSQKIVGYGNP